ncbi:hypothetical protein OIDMADRAFT_154960 [Oidiodendron maius Zn]|uniref:DUF1740-domain-containing protein n=1 Tax=Oidiodendron maius (strain Zn) TaxID=913774 RepID=A0A0C3HV95_OIDMZ|nr:hypothetical protein OIDMADRAFT_154960 [Oidiodendron maius Zn]
MSGSNIPVPKFASFRSKPAPSELQEKSTSRSSEHKNVQHRSQRLHAGGEFLDAPHPSDAEPLWVIDRKGDEKNLIYGSVHRYSIPPFHRAGGGGVLGASSSMQIDRHLSNEKSITLVNRKCLDLTAREKDMLSKIERIRPRLLKIRPKLLAETPSNEELDFVPLTQKIEKRKTADLEHSESDEARSYRSIHGKSKFVDQPADDAFQYASDSESSGSGRSTTANSSLDKMGIQLSRRVEQYPHDIDAWLALIEHQGSLILNDDRQRATNAEIRSTADIKIHMYEKALTHATSLQDRERLLLGLMAEGTKVWEIKDLTNRWERISEDHIDSIILWKSYADFKQSTFSSFRQEEVRDIFLKRIRLLLGVIKTTTPDSLNSLYSQLIYLLLRFTIFTRQSGYSELAIAIWQGVLEFNFFAPPSSTSFEARIASFKDFWESEVPRIGEDGARGWSHFVEKSDISEPPALIIDEIRDSLDNRDLFRSWAKAERQRSKASLIPGRTMDEIVEDDPFRVILFSDIEELLVPLPVNAKHLSRSLLNAYLLFCSQSPLSTSNADSSSISLDPFIEGETLDADPAWIHSEYLSKPTGFDNREAVLSCTLHVPWPRSSSTSESPFETMWFNKDLAEYYLAFEWRNEPDTIRKISKTLLKQRSSSLRLYNAYATIEWWRGNRDIATAVYTASINMSKSMVENECRDLIILWKNWVWTSLDDSDNGAALGRLLSIADCSTKEITNLTAAALLKTRQYLSSHRDFFNSIGDLSHAILHAECLVLLEYLSINSMNGAKVEKQGDIAAAMSAASDFSQNLMDRKMGTASSHERFLQSTSRLLYHHIRTGPFRPAFVREQLTKFLSIFPQNPIFLSLYAANESRLRIENRVRTMLSSRILTPKNDNLISRLFAIRYEVNHGSIYSVRSAFENALASSSSKGCAGLWKLYILYCLKTPQLRSGAKQIWFRALRTCPWAKELYVLGFEELLGLVDSVEYKEVWKIMGEKELRVHVDLEEIFDQMRELEDHRARKLI